MKVMYENESAPIIMELLGQYKVESDLDLINVIQKWRSRLQLHSIQPGTIVNFRAEYSQEAVALLYALLESRCIVLSGALNELIDKSQSLDFEIEIYIDQRQRCDFIRHHHVKIENVSLLNLKQQQKPYLLMNQGKTDPIWIAYELSDVYSS